MALANVDNFIIFEIEKSFSNTLKNAILNIQQNFNYFLSFNNYAPKKRAFTVGLNNNNDLSVSQKFVFLLENKIYNHNKWFFKEPLLIEENKADYLATCFYMINCLQEYAPNVEDHLNRFDLKKSYQKKFNCASKNLVLQYFQEIALQLFGEKIPLKKSEYILSHDIDFVNSAWKDETKTAIKNIDLTQIGNTAFNKLKGKDNWQNIEQIIEQEQNNKVHSTFFFLTEKGKTEYKKIKNADYNLTDRYIENCLHKINKSEYHNIGLHKSISSNTINEELTKLPVNKLRFHYLKFNVKEDFDKIEDSKIKEEFSLGFSTNIGFRNSYGLPFKPYSPISQKQYSFSVFPLNVMDSSLYYYKDIKDNNKMVEATIQFIYENKESCVLGILWHNNFYVENAYQKLLDCINNNQLTSY